MVTVTGWGVDLSDVIPSTCTVCRFGVPNPTSKGFLRSCLTTAGWNSTGICTSTSPRPNWPLEASPVFVVWPWKHAINFKSGHRNPSHMWCFCSTCTWTDFLLFWNSNTKKTLFWYPCHTIDQTSKLFSIKDSRMRFVPAWTRPQQSAWVLLTWENLQLSSSVTVVTRLKDRNPVSPHLFQSPNMEGGFASWCESKNRKTLDCKDSNNRQWSLEFMQEKLRSTLVTRPTLHKWLD